MPSGESSFKPFAFTNSNTDATKITEQQRLAELDKIRNEDAERDRKRNEKNTQTKIIVAVVVVGVVVWLVLK